MTDVFLQKKSVFSRDRVGPRDVLAEIQPGNFKGMLGCWHPLPALMTSHNLMNEVYETHVFLKECPQPGLVHNVKLLIERVLDAGQA